MINATIRWLKRAFSVDKDAVMDHVPVKRARQKKDWRDKALIAAAKKYNKPFKAAPNHLHREVMTKPDVFTAVKGGELATDAGKPMAPVMVMSRKKA